MSYQLYIANKNYSSWSLRPWLLMHELAIPFEEIVAPFSKSANWHNYRRFSPTGKVPCLLDNEQSIWDSLAIVEYLAESHPAVWPQSTDARAWARCASAEMHSGFVNIRTMCPMNVGVRIRLNDKSEPLEKDLARLIELWQQGLDRFGGPYLAGDKFTAVDAFFAPIAFRAQTYALELTPPAQRYIERMLNLSGMKKWQDEALREIWREEDHEQESLLCGQLIEDLRV